MIATKRLHEVVLDSLGDAIGLDSVSFVDMYDLSSRDVTNILSDYIQAVNLFLSTNGKVYDKALISRGYSKIVEDILQVSNVESRFYLNSSISTCDLSAKFMDRLSPKGMTAYSLIENALAGNPFINFVGVSDSELKMSISDVSHVIDNILIENQDTPFIHPYILMESFINKVTPNYILRTKMINEFIFMLIIGDICECLNTYDISNEDIAARVATALVPELYVNDNIYVKFVTGHNYNIYNELALSAITNVLTGDELTVADLYSMLKSKFENIDPLFYGRVEDIVDVVEHLVVEMFANLISNICKATNLPLYKILISNDSFSTISSSNGLYTDIFTNNGFDIHVVDTVKL